ncbi:Signal transduction histidine-protein kinase BarA [Salinivirga cyanobacteriivorans]|uniref:histidine kinase n=1 Tax=Salinivirga cyanobacteriivorans TaxID=1307839 RepID=A0A0S2HWC9_9BACT|nr:PAS domain S-box protein [Salinivirga cyanobacteriivorans]ALO14330.1 Signal transduction histidine-protein kinase BarA [Salinivirga cyanobacteriivorans]
MGPGKNSNLRAKARKILEQRGIKKDQYYTQNLESLIEELNIYQIELEQQNEEMVNAQLELQKSRQEFIDLFENAPYGYIIINRQNNILNANNKAAQILEMDKNTLVQQRFTKVIHPDSQDDFYFHVKHVFEKNKTEICELTIVTSRNSKKIVRIQSEINESKSTGHATMRMAVTDITEKVEATQALQRSEKKYKTIFENSGDGIVIFSEKIEDCNPQALNMFRYTKKELIGLRPGNDLSPELQPGGEKSDEKASLNIKKALELGPQQFHWKHKRKDGSVFDAQVTLSILTTEPKVQLIGIVRDISAQIAFENALQEKGEEIAAQNEEYASLNEELKETVEELQDTNNKLHESEKKFRKYIEASPTSIFILNNDYRVIYGNPSAEKLTGYSSYELYTKTLANLISSPDKNNALISHLEQNGILRNREISINHKKNIHKYALLSATQLDREAQTILYLTDITKQKQLDQQIYFEKEQWRRTFEAVNEGIYLIDKDFNIILCNAGFARIAGQKNPQELIGAKSHYVIHGQDIPLDSCPTCRTKKQQKTITHEFYEPNLGKNLKTTSTPVLDEDNQIEFYVNIIQDVTTQVKNQQELADSQKRLQLALEGANEGMWDWNIQTGEVIFNDIWFEMLGYKPKELPSAIDTWEKLIHPDDEARTKKLLQSHLEGKTSRYESTHRLRTKNGDWKWILDTGQVVEHDKNGNPIRAIGTHLDMTKQKHVEEELRKAKEKAEQADKLKSAFLANMSHEIRTPMNGIVGFTEILSKKQLSESKRSRIFQIIQSSSQQLLQLINDIVDISKIEANQLTIYKENFCLNKLLVEVYEQSKLELQKRNKTDRLNLKLDIPDSDSDFIVYSSATRIRQIFSNLIGNAMKFTEHGEIAFGYKLSSDNNLELFVQDTGIGISKEAQKIIFDRFIQAEPGTAKKYGGTGLGLFITRQLVNMLDGEITVKSKASEGSKFIIKLPQSANVGAQQSH